MNKYDFSFPNGFPLTQNRLKFMQDSYTELIQALGAVPVTGSAPVILTGMAVSGGGNTVTDGWFVYGGELIKFIGTTVAPPGGQVALVHIQRPATNLTFYDGIPRAAQIQVTAGLTSGVSVTDASNFPVTDLVPYAVGLGIIGRESTYSTLVVNTLSGVGGVTGNVFYRKNFMNNTMQIFGSMTANNAQNFSASPGATYHTMGVLPVGYWPVNQIFFTAQNIAVPLITDDTPSPIQFLSCGIDTVGQIFICWLKPSGGVASYSINFNHIVPLD